MSCMSSLILITTIFRMKTFEELNVDNPQLHSERSPPQPAILGKVPEIPTEKSKALNEAWAELEKQEWYHGMIPIEDVKSVLHGNGEFLVRKIDNQNKTTPPVLTVLWDDTLFHFPIYGNQKSDGSGMEFTLNTVNYCPNYSEVINLHVYQKLPIFSEVILVKGAPKQVIIKVIRKS
ncbi:SH2 domain protein [Dictyocaulus viviparus]|uniref:SH2 domain protein n=1 Tax=Dictyocaulus viviparus TaxID=29172 RepID=A0A0D8YA31_DICVI|nr:SH2 domain protein [Dictyocaulus viviparus]